MAQVSKLLTGAVHLLDLLFHDSAKRLPALRFTNQSLCSWINRERTSQKLSISLAKLHVFASHRIRAPHSSSLRTSLQELYTLSIFCFVPHKISGKVLRKCLDTFSPARTRLSYSLRSVRHDSVSHKRKKRSIGFVFLHLCAGEFPIRSSNKIFPMILAEVKEIINNFTKL